MYSLNEPNIGGVNGLGTKPIDTDSEDFLALREAIERHAGRRSREDRQQDMILGIELRIRSYIGSAGDSGIVHAGSFLSELIAAVDITKKHFANYVGIDYSNLITILKGRRKVSAELAVKVEQIFGIRAQHWFHIEAKNEFLQFKESDKERYNYTLEELTQ